MDTHVEIGGRRYPASVSGRLRNQSWDGRDTKAITLTMDYATAAQLFVDGTSWSIVCQEEGQPEEEYDNSEYSVAGDIIVHRDGTVTVMMGKATELERALVALLMQ